MRNPILLASAVVTSLAFAAPAYAGATISLPEPDTVTMLAMGIAGVFIGRRLAVRRASKD